MHSPEPVGNSLLIDLALQGGGAHGAFTWGVLDRILEEPGLQIDGISGTSAGAMNAAVLADGYASGGREGARAALEDFWSRVSRAALMSPFRRTPLDVLMGRWTMDTSPMFITADLMARLFSPYDLNPHEALQASFGTTVPHEDSDLATRTGRFSGRGGGPDGVRYCESSSGLTLVKRVFPVPV